MKKRKNWFEDKFSMWKQENYDKFVFENELKKDTNMRNKMKELEERAKKHVEKNPNIVFNVPNDKLEQMKKDIENKSISPYIPKDLLNEKRKLEHNIDYLASFNIQVVPDDADIDRRLTAAESRERVDEMIKKKKKGL